MLSKNDIKEELSYAYLHAIAAKVGYSCDRPSKDRDSIDAQVKARFKEAEEVEFTSPEISFQLKATSTIEIQENKFQFDLPMKNYKDLKKAHPFPRLLMILILPPDENQWLSVEPEQLIARTCAYWCNIKPLSDVTNETTKRIDIYTSNILALESLVELMKKSSKREEIGHAL